MSKTIPMEQAVQLALEQHKAGNFSRAEGLYVEILRQDPGNIDAMHLLGVLAHQGHKPEVAVELISRAISRRDNVGIFHYNLAEAYVALKRSEDAVKCYERSIELDPENVSAFMNLSNVLIHAANFVRAEEIARRGLELEPDNGSLLINLGTAYRGLGQHEKARVFYERALAKQPDFVEAITNLAICACAQGQFDEGLALFRRAVQLRPAVADAHNNLGAALIQQRRVEEAAECFQTATDIKPDHVEALNNLGSALRALGKVDLSIPLFEKAVKHKPDFVEAHANLAAALADLQRNEPALESLDRAIALRPHSAPMHFLRGIILRNMRRLDEGIAAIRRTLEIQPDQTDALTTLGYSLLEQGDLDGAVDALKRSILTKPDPQSHSNVLMTVSYHPGFSATEYFDMHKRWAEFHEAPHLASRVPHDNDRTPERKLRIGYVSPDFRGHSVAYFLEPILSNHDHAQFEIYGYAHVINFDLSTYRLRTEIDHWRETSGKPHEDIAKMIRDDKIDILIDLAGHTGGNLLPVFARKPAPVQINMIGFPSTTGLTSMDYRVTDARCDPPGPGDALNSEVLIRMPEIFWVYQPPNDAPEVGKLPADENGYFTFTSVNNFTKVTPQVQQMWAKLLAAVPNSRLIIQTSAMNSAYLQGLVRDRMAAEGIGAERLDFRPWSDLTGYFKLLERSDISLDPFPFNGGTTTCHSLWMGAPVLTLAGDRHASRMGLSMMTCIGLPDFVAHTPEQYVEIGRAMANDLPRMRDIRAGMRERLKSSPLLDAPNYTRHLESKYRQAWAKWCVTEA